MINSFAMAVLSVLNALPGLRPEPAKTEPTPSSGRFMRACAMHENHGKSDRPVLKDRYLNRPGDDVPLVVGQLRRDPQYRGRDEWHNGSGLGVCRIVALEGKRARVQPIGQPAYYSTTVRVDRLARWPLVVNG
jgi:hypothetical protein